MIMTQFTDSRMRNSGRQAEIKQRTDSGKHKYTGKTWTGLMKKENCFFTPSFSLEGEGQCPQSLLDPEPAHSEAATLTAVGDMFMASSEIICFKMNTSELYFTCRYEPRERSNSVMSTLSSRMRQFGPSRDYPYALPGEFSEEEEEEEEEVEEKEEVKEEKEEIRKEEPEENEKKEEKKKEDDDIDDTASVSCICSEKVEKERGKIEVKEKKKDEEQKQDVDVKETTEIKEWNLKRNPMKTMIAAKIDRGNHISSRFY